jgi:hypothetical protein
MEEKDVIELSTDIVEGLTKLSMGFNAGVFSGKVIKSLESHSNLEEIKSLFTEHITSFKGAYNTSEELKTLIDFRFKLVEAYNKH